MMADQEDEPAATDLELPTDCSSEAESDSSSEAAPARLATDSESDSDNDEMPSLLGEAFFHGKYNLPKDPARARYWLEKVMDGECEHKHLNERAVLADATEMFLALDW